jgi:hypothetical protein
MIRLVVAGARSHFPPSSDRSYKFGEEAIRVAERGAQGVAELVQQALVDCGSAAPVSVIVYLCV